MSTRNFKIKAEKYHYKPTYNTFRDKLKENH